MGDETISSVRSRRAAKSASAFRTISEVADELGLEQHVLRFWETKFAQIKPMKRGGGRRYYRPEDVILLENIRNLLRNDGYTIKGVQRLLKEGRLSKVPSPGPVMPAKSQLSPPHSPPVGEEAVLAVMPQPLSGEHERSPIRAPEAVATDKLQSVLRELQELRQMAALIAKNKL